MPELTDNLRTQAMQAPEILHMEGGEIALCIGHVEPDIFREAFRRSSTIGHRPDEGMAVTNIRHTWGTVGRDHHYDEVYHWRKSPTDDGVLPMTVADVVEPDDLEVSASA